jgi:fatty-acyl-CoA synthase
MHPKIADVAMVGVPNEEMGEEVKAVAQADIGVTKNRALYKKVHVMDLLNC